MKKKMINLIPAACFLLGFLISTLFLPADSQILSDGETYFGDPSAISFWDIFLNNTFMCIIFILGCGVGSSVMLLIQGFAFGTTYVLWVLMGNAIGDFMLLFAPHVIFEFVAMAIAGYLGFRLLDFLSKKTEYTFLDLLRKNRIPLVLTFGSVLVAALVECYITPFLHIVA